MEILRQRSGELVVLHGQEPRGFRVAYRNMSYCFHLFTLLQGALAAESKVLLKLNVEAANLDAITDVLPSLHAPTINSLETDNWVAVEAVVDEAVVREIVPELKRSGAEGIIELPLNKVIP